MRSLTINYKGTAMQVFDQIRVGRFRLYSAAIPDCLASVRDAWKKAEFLGKPFTVKPIHDQVIGEEVLDNGRVVAVFGVAITNAFIPDPELQKNYLGKLTQIVQQTS
jgi:hypothetical protein